MKILVVTETDACCGPMAAAFLRDYSPLVKAVSAGRNPAKTMDSKVVVLMKECLVDLTGLEPRDVKTLDVSAFDFVYDCPDLPIPETIEEGRKLRDFIKNEAYLFFKKISS